VTIYDRMPTPGRKFLMAGHGGLNLTNDEPLELFLTRYSASSPLLAAAIESFPPSALRSWAEGLGQDLFVGTSGRVFPKVMKTSPLLRAWRARLETLGVSFVLRTRWLGWDKNGALLFENEAGGKSTLTPKAYLLALGGASWPQLGSDAAWVPFLQEAQIPLAPFEPSNCGFIAPWSAFFAERFAGQPLKPVTLHFEERTIQGELMITTGGLEGGAIYALSGALRRAIQTQGEATLTLDLRPGLDEATLRSRLSVSRGSQSLSTFLHKAGGLAPQAIGLVREVTHTNPKALESPEKLATLIKALPLKLTATAPIARAISCAGGVKLEALDEQFMVRERPGLFIAGEMLDWDAPTGGYLLQACFSTGMAAAKGIKAWLYNKGLAR